MLTFLVDTGSEVSLLNSKIITELNVEGLCYKTANVSLVGANKKKLYEVSKGISAKITFNKKECHMQFLIVDQMSHDAVIGTNELDKNAVIIDYVNGQLEIDGEIIKFCKENKDRNMNYEDNVEVLNLCRNVNNSDGQIIPNKVINCDIRWKTAIEELLSKNCELINEESRVAKKYVHQIEVKGIEHFKSKSYPIPYKYKNEVEKEIQNMLDQNIIEKCNSKFINPIVVVKKNNGELRLCLDARNINKYTTPQYEAPMNIESIFGKITGSSIFTKIDLKHSFWLIPLHINSRDYTAFTVDGVLYRFKVVPFGLQSSCSALVRALHSILDKYDFIVHYIDDILIYSKKESDHFQHIEIIVSELNNAGLKINLDKCNFFQKQVKFLGYQLDDRGVTMDEERVQCIKNYKRPYNVKTLRGFLGLINYFKKLMPDMSQKQLPLIRLLKKGVKWAWKKEQEDAFNQIKEEFLKNLRVYHPQYDKSFILRTDASMYKFAGVLLQEQNGKEVPICFVSRVTKDYEKRYGISELEFASILFCVKKLRYYLLGSKFYIETDHSSLLNVMNNRINNNRIHRGSLLLQEYDFEIKYIPGKINVVADSLTRDEKGSKLNRKFHVGINILKEPEGIFSQKEIVIDQSQMSPDDVSRCTKIGNVYVKLVKNRELYFISENLAAKILKYIHEEYQHLGVRKTWLVFRENYIAKNDTTIIKNITRRCKICQLFKNKNYVNYNIPKNIVSRDILDTVAIDFFGELIISNNNKKFVLVMVDVFTKFIKLFACKRTNFVEIKDCLVKYISEVGKPSKLILDNATYFQSERFRKFCNNKGIQLNFTSIRHPESNPAERYVQETLKFLRILTQNNHRDWDLNLEQIEYFLNSTPNTVTEECPLFLMKQKRPVRKWLLQQQTEYSEILEEVRRRSAKKGIRYLKRMEKKKRKKNIVFKKGDLVLIRALRVSDIKNNICSKLLPALEGPFIVASENNINSYVLKYLDNERVRGIFHINDVFEYRT